MATDHGYGHRIPHVLSGTRCDHLSKTARTCQLTCKRAQAERLATTELYPTCTTTSRGSREALRPKEKGSHGWHQTGIHTCLVGSRSCATLNRMDTNISVKVDTHTHTHTHTTVPTGWKQPPESHLSCGMWCTAIGALA